MLDLESGPHILDAYRDRGPIVGEMDFGAGLRALKSVVSFSSPFHFNRNAGLSLFSNPGNNKGYLYIAKIPTSKSRSLASRRFCASK